MGNDIVDLSEEIHPRFLDRVCTPEEREVVLASQDPHRALWTQWAMKEATYKAVKKQDPLASFIPRQFVVTADRCQYKQFTARIQVIQTKDYVHATALLWSCKPMIVIRAQRDARQLAAEVLGGLGYPECEIRGKPPQVYKQGMRLDLDVSLSHDGRFAAICVSINPWRCQSSESSLLLHR